MAFSIALCRPAIRYSGPKPALPHNHHSQPRPLLRAPRASHDGNLLRVIELDRDRVRHYKAYWLKPYDYAPPNDKTMDSSDSDRPRARGAVLFMHGFAQNPKAYFTMLKELAARGFLVVAPSTRVYRDESTQQEMMVDRAEFFLRGMRDGSLLESFEISNEDQTTIKDNMALFAHSVGAGLSMYVAARAAKAGSPFKAVVTLAPKTDVVTKYAPETVLEGGSDWEALWPSGHTSTHFLVQYGLIDVIAPFWLALGLKKTLTKRFGSNAVGAELYLGGTHVGFQDQLFVDEKDVDSDILPAFNTVIKLLGLGLPGILVLMKLLLWTLLNLLAKATKKEVAQKPTPDPTETPVVTKEPVKLAPNGDTFAYVGLLAAVGALTVFLADVTQEIWESYPCGAGAGLVRAVPLAATVLAGFSFVTGVLEIALDVFYVDSVQWPEAKVS